MTRFNHAIVRRPGANFADGLTTSPLGPPNYARTLRQYQAYCDALRRCGLTLIELPADPQFPDGTFVEDTAVVTDRCAIITRPGHPSRRGEEIAIEKALLPYRPLERILAPGTVDGGDVLRVEDHFYIGLSERTNAAGARQLSHWLDQYGYPASTAPVRRGLHLKSGLSYIGQGRLVARENLLDRPEFEKLHKIPIRESEAYAANCLLVNEHLLLAQGFPDARAKLSLAHPSLLELDMTEFEKMDGGLTCLSLRF